MDDIDSLDEVANAQAWLAQQAQGNDCEYQCALDSIRDPIIFQITKLMADIANKYSENVAGKFYVDNQCIDCDLCRETAPNNLTRSDDGGYSFVKKQPSAEEEAQCKEAKEGCPVEAIGDDAA